MKKIKKSDLYMPVAPWVEAMVTVLTMAAVLTKFTQELKNLKNQNKMKIFKVNTKEMEWCGIPDESIFTMDSKENIEFVGKVDMSYFMYYWGDYLRNMLTVHPNWFSPHHEERYTNQDMLEFARYCYRKDKITDHVDKFFEEWKLTRNP
jgi:hypothetical protein